VHLHALIRIDGHDPANPEAFEPPPFGVDVQGNRIQLWSAADLKEAVQDAARSTAIRTEGHETHPAGWPITWGTQVDVRVVHDGLPGGELTERHVAGYLAKYATKATEITGLNPDASTAKPSPPTPTCPGTSTGSSKPAGTGRLEPWDGLRHWAHRFGFPGHFSTKSRATAPPSPHCAKPDGHRTGSKSPPSTATHSNSTTCTTTKPPSSSDSGATSATAGEPSGDAALAAMAADAARQRVPAGLAPAHP
jgi:hypothetical protein